MGINNLLYQYQNTNEFVCSDGRMSVNGICKPLEPEPKKQNNQELINQIVTANKNDKNFAKDLLTTDKYRDGFGITSEGNYVNKFSGGDPGSVTGKDYSKDVKSTFEWDFDKVGNKIANFGTTVKGNINAYDDYIEENFGIPKAVNYGTRAVSVGMGISSYGAVGALVPFAIPFMAGGALNNKQKKENERITQATMKDPQGGDNTVDMATYGIPTAGQPGFNIHNDAGDNNNNQSNNVGGGTFGDSVNDNSSFSDYS